MFTEKLTDHHMLNEFYDVFGCYYNTANNKQLFKSKNPDGWFEYNNNLIIIENKKDLKNKCNGFNQLLDYFYIVKSNNENYKKYKIIYLILGLGTDKDFQYFIYIEKNKVYQTNLKIKDIKKLNCDINTIIKNYAVIENNNKKINFDFQIFLNIINTLKSNNQYFISYISWFNICSKIIKISKSEFTIYISDKIKDIIFNFSKNWDKFDNQNFDIDYARMETESDNLNYSLSDLLNEIKDFNIEEYNKFNRLIYNYYDSSLYSIETNWICENNQYIIKPKTEFNIKYAEELFKSEPEDITNIDYFKTCQYLNNYIFRLKGENRGKYAYYDLINDSFEILTADTLDKEILNKFENSRTFIKNNEKYKKSMLDLFKIHNYNNCFIVVSQLNKPKIYKDDKNNYINIGKSSLYYNCLPEDDKQNKLINKGLDLLLNYIKNYISFDLNNENKYNDLIQWFSYVIQNKNPKINIIFNDLKDEYIIKFLTFIKNYVLGSDIVLFKEKEEKIKDFDNYMLLIFNNYNFGDKKNQKINNKSNNIIYLTTENTDKLKDKKDYLILSKNNKIIDKNKINCFNLLKFFINNKDEEINKQMGKKFYFYLLSIYDEKYKFKIEYKENEIIDQIIQIIPIKGQN